MRHHFLQFVLLAIVTLVSTTARADLYPYTKRVTDADTKQVFFLDLDAKKAAWMGFDTKNVAPETTVIPSSYTYENVSYEVVEVGRTNNTSYSYYYTDQENTVSVTVPSTVKRLNKYSFSCFSKCKKFTIGGVIETVAENAFYDCYDARVIFMCNPPVFEGQLTGSTSDRRKLYITVPKDCFEKWIVTDWAEQHCIAINPDNLQDDPQTAVYVNLEPATYHTGNIDSGELGYAVIANQLPKVITYSMINKLVVDAGTMNKDDWYQIRQMRNLLSLDLSNVDIEEIPQGALNDCWQLNEVILPNRARIIRGNAFQNCGFNGPLMPYASITVPKTLDTVTGSSTFASCRMLKKLDMVGYPILSLPSSFAYNCPMLYYVTLPSGLETLGDNAFHNCDILKIDIPQSLRKIENSTFRSNTHLSQLHFCEPSVTSYIDSYAFESCPSLVGDGYVLKFPASMRYIGYEAFSGDRAITAIDFNEGLEELYYYTFNGCIGLTEITLPSSLKYATYNPFNNCSNLMSITCRSILPPTIENRIITSSAGNRELHVPMWSFQEYMTTPGWLEFQDHMSIDENIRPENVYIYKEFEFLLKENSEMGKEFANYHPNLKLQQNTDRIGDGFGHEKTERGNLTISSNAYIDAKSFEMTFSPFAKYFADQSISYGYNYDAYRTDYNPNSLITRPHHSEPSAPNMHTAAQSYKLQLQNDIWQFVTFPMPVNMKDIVPEDGNTQWVIREYDGDLRAKGEFDKAWKPVSMDMVLSPRKGYAMKCYNNGYNYNQPVNFTFVPTSQANQDIFFHKDYVAKLDTYGCDDDLVPSVDKGWTLIGNPYPCFYDTRYIDADMLFLVWDSYNKNYKAYSTEDDAYILNPGESFFVQIPRIEDKTFDGESLTFLNAGRQTYRNPNDLEVDPTITPKALRRSSALRGGNPNRKVFNITLSDGEMSDQTRVVLNEEATTQYEAGRDISKMMSDEAALQIWTVNNKSQLAINERPMLAGLVPMSVSCAKPGTYTLQLGTNSCDGYDVFVEDKVMNTTTQITAERGYSFNTNEAGTVDGRFVLTFKAADATAIRNISDATNENGNDAFNVAGQKVNADAKGIIVTKGKKILK